MEITFTQISINHRLKKYLWVKQPAVLFNEMALVT